MKRKLIFFDIDNTILDHFNGGIVPPSTLDALFQLRANGHTVGIATGKGPSYIERFLPEFGFDTYVALNGNIVNLDGKRIYTDSFDKDRINEFIQYAHKNDFPLTCGHLQGTRTIYKDDPRIQAYYDHFNASYPEIIEDFKELGSIHQMSVVVNIQQEQQVKQAFPEFTYARMNEFGMNVNPPGGGKEKGIAKILELTDFTKDDLIVFGDGLNDIGMFKLADTSIALGNAENELKELATYVTSPVYEDGIYKACKELDLI